MRKKTSAARPTAPKFDNESQKVNEDVWYYEGGRGLEFVVYGGRPAQFVVPWKLIDASAKRREAVRAHRRAKTKS